jgi:epoxyqueuosine reductase QueG
VASAENRLKTLARSLGADRVGVTSRQRLAGGPPSADPRYLLSGARAVISFAVALDGELVDAFIGKTSWRPHCHNRKAVARTLYTIGDALVELLRTEGYAAVNVDLNNNYRPEVGAADVTEMTDFHPEFAHRYAALAAGVGRLGWSGNLLTRPHGARVELGSVLTTADLRPDDPIADEDNPCDRCRICTRVCPVEMIDPRAETSVSVAGITETIARKRPNTCCWIGCTGYEGLSTTGTWSNWSPFRLGRPLPVEKEELDALCIRLQKADPQMQAATNGFSHYRQAVFDPAWFYYTVCGFCRSVCAPDRADRIANGKRILRSGTAALGMDGRHLVAGEDAIAVPTPFGLNLVVAPGRHPPQAATSDPGAEQSPLEKASLKYIADRIAAAVAAGKPRVDAVYNTVVTGTPASSAEADESRAGG